jgi:hypothetical protein
MKEMKLSGAELIAQERARQVASENWTAEHDDTHSEGELAEAAACYAASGVYSVKGWDLRRVIEYMSWPWRREWWKPTDDPIRNLVKAGALIAAEIDRLQRLKASEASNG